MQLPERWADLRLGEDAFPGPLRDQLVAAIIGGSKTSTSSLVQDYLANGETPVCADVTLLARL